LQQLQQSMFFSGSCKKSTSGLFSLQSNRVNPLQCITCDEIFTSMEQLQKHITNDRKAVPYTPPCTCKTEPDLIISLNSYNLVDRPLDLNASRGNNNNNSNCGGSGSKRDVVQYNSSNYMHHLLNHGWSLKFNNNNISNNHHHSNGKNRNSSPILVDQWIVKGALVSLIGSEKSGKTSLINKLTFNKLVESSSSTSELKQFVMEVQQALVRRETKLKQDIQKLQQQQASASSSANRNQQQQQQQQQQVKDLNKELAVVQEELTLISKEQQDQQIPDAKYSRLFNRQQQYSSADKHSLKFTTYHCFENSGSTHEFCIVDTPSLNSTVDCYNSRSIVATETVKELQNTNSQFNNNNADDVVANNKGIVVQQEKQDHEQHTSVSNVNQLLSLQSSNDDLMLDVVMNISSHLIYLVNNYTSVEQGQLYKIVEKLHNQGGSASKKILVIVNYLHYDHEESKLEFERQVVASTPGFTSFLNITINSQQKSLPVYNCSIPVTTNSGNSSVTINFVYTHKYSLVNFHNRQVYSYIKTHFLSDATSNEVSIVPSIVKYVNGVAKQEGYVDDDSNGEHLYYDSKLKRITKGPLQHKQKQNVPQKVQQTQTMPMNITSGNAGIGVGNSTADSPTLILLSPSPSDDDSTINSNNDDNLSLQTMAPSQSAQSLQKRHSFNLSTSIMSTMSAIMKRQITEQRAIINRQPYNLVANFYKLFEQEQQEQQGNDAGNSGSKQVDVRKHKRKIGFPDKLLVVIETSYGVAIEAVQVQNRTLVVKGKRHNPYSNSSYTIPSLSSSSSSSASSSASSLVNGGSHTNKSYDCEAFTINSAFEDFRSEIELPAMEPQCSYSEEDSEIVMVKSKDQAVVEIIIDVIYKFPL